MLLKFTLEEMMLLIPVILISLTVHEFSHGFVSYILGDQTAKQGGRLTLNPIKHLDILGTIMIFVSGFGWAKPVPINPRYYKNKKVGVVLVSLAGPLANILLALITAFFLYYTAYTMAGSDEVTAVSKYLLSFLRLLYSVNLGLAAFNILPIPPLDGSKILGAVLPAHMYFKMMQYQHYITMGFFLILFAFNNILNRVIMPIIMFLDAGIIIVVKFVLPLITGIKFG